MSLLYKEGRLNLGSGDLFSLLEANKGHACYVYDLQNIERRYLHLQKCLSSLKNLSVHYALKANGNHQVLKKFKALGSRPAESNA